MILTDHFLLLLYFLLSYSKDTSQSITSHWVQNTVSRFSNSSPKGSTGCWLNWLTKATKHCGPSKNSITEVPEGSLRFENVCQHFIINPKGPLASWMFFRMTRSLYSVLYKYEASPPQIMINLTYLDICHILKLRIPPLNSNIRLMHYSDITYWFTL